MTQPKNEVCCVKTNKSSENKSSCWLQWVCVQLDQLRLIRWRVNRAHQRSSVYICSKHPHCCYSYVSPNLNLTLSLTPTEEWVQRETPSYRGKLSKLERTLAQRQPSQSGERLDMGLKVHIFRQAHLEKSYSVHMKGATNRRKPWFRYTADQSQWAWMSDCFRELQKWSKRCGGILNIMSDLCFAWFLARQIEQQWICGGKNRDKALFIDTAHLNRSIVPTLEPRYHYIHFLWGFKVIGAYKVTDRSHWECRFHFCCCDLMSQCLQNPSGFMQYWIFSGHTAKTMLPLYIAK